MGSTRKLPVPRSSTCTSCRASRSWTVWYTVFNEIVGISARAPHYWETVYRTNLATSYQVGRWKQITEPAVRAARPYLRYVSARLPTSRQSHVDKHGLVYPTDHPFWRQWYPPNGFNCKCTVMSVSESLLDRRGWKMSTESSWDSPDQGFAVNAGLSDAV